MFALCPTRSTPTQSPTRICPWSLTIRVDDRPTEFGVTGRSVLADLAKQYAEQYGGKRPTGSCPPYLTGKVGATMTCRLRTPEGRLRIRVKVSKVDPENYTTEYLFKAVGRRG